MNLEAIALKIERNIPGRKRGINLYLNNMPATVTDGILLIQKPSDQNINWELPGYCRSGFQAIIRCADYKTGKAMADKVFALLTIQREELIGDMLIRYIRPKHYPAPYPISIGDLTEFSINFDSVYVMV